MGLEFEILKRSGAWFYYGETRLGQGRDAVKQLFVDNPEFAAEIREKIMEKYNEFLNGKNKGEAPAEPEEVIMPVEAEPIPHKKINIDIAVDD